MSCNVSKEKVGKDNCHEQHVCCPARKFTYNCKTSVWLESDCIIRVLSPLKYMGKGGMRYCYDVEEVGEDGTALPMVAKLFRSDIDSLTVQDYFSEAEVQCMCEAFADNFNRAPTNPSIKRPNFSFLQCYVVIIKSIPEEYKEQTKGFFSFRVPTTGEVVFCMELKLVGRFTKYNSNYGDTYHNDTAHSYTEEEAKEREEICDAAEAFSHFTLSDSGGSMLVCDLQGLNDFLTDPQIHTESGSGLGLGNMGMRGIQKWISQHKCNKVCRALCLGGLDQESKELPAGVDGSDSAIKEEYRRLRAMCQINRPVRPIDIVPTKKPLSEMTEEEKMEYALEVSRLTSS